MLPRVIKAAILSLCLAAAGLPVATAQAQQFDRIQGGTACIANQNGQLLDLFERPSGQSRILAPVLPNNCYPTGGCEGGWCAVETPAGRGYMRDRGITINVPIVERAPQEEATTCGWYAILGTSRTRIDALAQMRNIGADNLAMVVDNSTISGFTNGYHSVVFGPYQSRAEAERQANVWRNRVPDAYAKSGCPRANADPATDLSNLRAQSWGGNVRSGPGTQYSSVGSLPEGAPIRLIERSNAMFNGYPWFRIAMPNGRTGYQWGGIICGVDSRIPGAAGICGNLNSIGTR